MSAERQDDPSTRLRARLTWFADHGWPVFALTGSKRPYAGCRLCPAGAHRFETCPHPPRFCHGHLAASLHVQHLAALWRSRPESVPGISLGPASLVVLDADGPSHGEVTAAPWADMRRVRDGLDVLAELFARHGQTWPPNDTLRVATPSGGQHLYYRLPPGVEVLSKPLVLGSLVDVKARGGYVVAPGSTTTTGLYQRAGDVVEPLEAPAWLIRLLSGTGHMPPARRPPSDDAQLARPTGEGVGPNESVARRVDGIRERLAGCRSGRHAAIATASTALAHLVSAAQLAETEACDLLVAAALAAYDGTEISPRRAERDARDAWRSALARARQ